MFFIILNSKIKILHNLINSDIKNDISITLRVYHYEQPSGNSVFSISLIYNGQTIENVTTSGWDGVGRTEDIYRNITISSG